MGRSYKPHKNSQTKWDDYEPLGTEPQERKSFDMTPELEEELLDHSLLLKKRVWRQINKIHKDYARPTYSAHYVKPRHRKLPHFRNGAAHIF